VKRVLVWAPLIIILALVCAFAVVLLRPNETTSDPLVGEPLPSLPLTDFLGGRGDFIPAQTEGPYLLNLWASWCAPCRIEHPMLTSLADQGVPIYGMVYKDDPEDARAFLSQLGDPFTGLAQDRDGRAAIELGVTGAPETFVIDGDGIIRARWRGAITDIVWIQTLGPAWRTAGGAPVDTRALPQAGGAG
jgi:cytochrome c biogenesis protein CcmG/thiol:disulfide interchange protein DsbE